MVTHFFKRFLYCFSQSFRKKSGAGFLLPKQVSDKYYYFHNGMVNKKENHTAIKGMRLTMGVFYFINVEQLPACWCMFYFCCTTLASSPAH